ncbi:hypothetical protein SNEBB_001394 [Seison nebaliae]|nr:hypothetical protein SNEBB_001394 [Seison nebaliae]
MTNKSESVNVTLEKDEETIKETFKDKEEKTFISLLQQSQQEFSAFAVKMLEYSDEVRGETLQKLFNQIYVTLNNERMKNPDIDVSNNLPSDLNERDTFSKMHELSLSFSTFCLYFTGDCMEFRKNRNYYWLWISEVIEDVAKNSKYLTETLKEILFVYLQQFDVQSRSDNFVNKFQESVELYRAQKEFATTMLKKKEEKEREELKKTKKRQIRRPKLSDEL